MRRTLALSGCIGVLCLSGQAVAQQDTVHAAVDREKARPEGMAEVGLGWLVLPAADVCVERNIAGCTKGDSSLQLDAWQIFRLTPAVAIGAGIAMGLTPTTDAPRRDPPGIERDHSRGYFMAEGVVRYYPIVQERFEGWVGITSGMVVVSDRFQSTEGKTDRALVGPRGVTIRSEGYTVGLAIGAAYRLSSSWSVGSSLRYGSWFLPRQPGRNPLGDEASLVGQNDVFSLALSLAYRVPL